MDFESELKKIKFEEDEADMDMLYDFIDRLELTDSPREAVPSIIFFLEEHGNKNLGSPGPLVHFLEEREDYQVELLSSIERNPTEITIWMANRIINGLSTSERNLWLEALKKASTHTNANENARNMAKEFLEYQDAKI